jgi:hypothetical protein
MTMTTNAVPTKGELAADDPARTRTTDEKVAPAEAETGAEEAARRSEAEEQAREVRYTVLASVDDGRTWTMLGEFKAANQREARQAAVASNDPLRTAILEQQQQVQLVAIAKFSPVSASLRKPEPEFVV